MRITATVATFLVLTSPLMQIATASDKPITSRSFFPETFAALAMGYVQGVEHNRARDIRIIQDGNAASPDISVHYSRMTVKGSEEVHGIIVYGYDKNGQLSVTSYSCTPCAAR